jgi:hypothetical protein
LFPHVWHDIVPARRIRQPWSDRVDSGLSQTTDSKRDLPMTRKFAQATAPKSSKPNLLKEASPAHEEIRISQDLKNAIEALEGHASAADPAMLQNYWGFGRLIREHVDQEIRIAKAAGLKPQPTLRQPWRGYSARIGPRSTRLVTTSRSSRRSGGWPKSSRCAGKTASRWDSGLSRSTPAGGRSNSPLAVETKPNSNASKPKRSR